MRPVGKLLLTLPDGSTRALPLERERVTIGRRPDNDICLPFPAVSGEHAAVVTILDDSFLEDLHSTNGTLVNGKSITKHFLREGDEIDIGRQKLVYVGDDLGQGEAPRLPRGDPDATAPLNPMVHRAATTATIDTSLMPLDDLPGAAGNAARRAVPPEPPPAPAAPKRRVPSMEVLDGASAGTLMEIAGDEFIVGRVGAQLARVTRTEDGYRLEHLEGEQVPTINGAPLPGEGSRLALGDEIVIAGVRLVFRPAL